MQDADYTAGQRTESLAGAGPSDRVKAEARALAGLRQAVWEASQFVSPSYTKSFVSDVLREIKSDEP